MSSDPAKFTQRQNCKPRFESSSSVCLDHSSGQNWTLKLWGSSRDLPVLFGCFPVVWLDSSVCLNIRLFEGQFVRICALFTFSPVSCPQTLALIIIPLPLKHLLSANCITVSSFPECLLATMGEMAKKEPHLRVPGCEVTGAHAWCDHTHSYSEHALGQRLI